MKNTLITLLGMLAVLFLLDTFRAYDDTDDEPNGERSGLQLYIDHGTGCEYIKAGWFGELKPRLFYSTNTFKMRHMCHRSKRDD